MTGQRLEQKEAAANVADRMEYRPPSALQRIRSALLLLLLITVLGALTAGIIGVLVVAGVSLIDHALG